MIGFLLWALLFAAMVALEGLSLTLRGHAWPSLSDLMRSATRPVVGRWLLLALWLWFGWHTFIRGWSFFLRGAGASEPRKGLGGGKGLGATMTQVVLPLVVLYSALIAMLVTGWRARLAASGSESQDVRRAAAAVRGRRGAFLRYTAVTLLASYLVFVGATGLYELIVGQSAAGLLRDAVTGGAFMAFGLELPVFVIASIVWSVIMTHRRRPRGRTAMHP